MTNKQMLKALAKVDPDWALFWKGAWRLARRAHALGAAQITGERHQLSMEATDHVSGFEILIELDYSEENRAALSVIWVQSYLRKPTVQAIRGVITGEPTVKARLASSDELIALMAGNDDTLRTAARNECVRRAGL